MIKDLEQEEVYKYVGVEESNRICNAANRIEAINTMATL